jgi:hypothetical protein
MDQLSDAELMRIAMGSKPTLLPRRNSETSQQVL